MLQAPPTIVAVTLIWVPVETVCWIGALVVGLLRRFTPLQAANIAVPARTRLGTNAEPTSIARTAPSMSGPRNGEAARRGRRAAASNTGVPFAGAPTFTGREPADHHPMVPGRSNPIGPSTGPYTNPQIKRPGITRAGPLPARLSFG